jgi:hypothetical protein
LGVTRTFWGVSSKNQKIMLFEKKHKIIIKKISLSVGLNFPEKMLYQYLGIFLGKKFKFLNYSYVMK